MGDSGSPGRPGVVGVNLKTYLGSRETMDWCHAIIATAAALPDVLAGAVGLFVLPTTPLLAPVLAACRGTRVRVGAQDVSTDPPGPHTGEISAALLAEIGCQDVLIGHAERRRRFRESDAIVARKVAITLWHGLRPVVCVGERNRVGAAQAAALSIAQAERALAASTDLAGPVILAYEPIWAIGATEPAPPDHIADVCDALGRWLDDLERGPSSSVIYGGSAGPGLLTLLGASVDGLFLGRFAHDPQAVLHVLDEVRQVRSGPSSADRGR